MKTTILFILISFFSISVTFAQVQEKEKEVLANKSGIALYPINSKIGIKFSPIKHLGFEVRMDYRFWAGGYLLLLNLAPNFRAYYYKDYTPKIRSYAGLGIQYNETLAEEFILSPVYSWAEIPIGVEIFPFTTLPNLCLLFEVNPYFNISEQTSDKSGTTFLAGIVYYSRRK